MRVSVLFYSFFPPRILPTPDVNRSFHNGVLAVSNDMLPIPGTKPKQSQAYSTPKNPQPNAPSLWKISDKTTKHQLYIHQF